ncbi:MAG: hypothetical protein ACKO6N_21945 [Myxococcota bacterium]
MQIRPTLSTDSPRYANFTRLGTAGLLTMVALVGGMGCNDTPLGERTYVDEYVQPPASPVDVLFVVDNSDSMREDGGELDRVVAGFDSFIANLSEANIEFHIGVTTTDMSAESASNPGTQGRLVEAKGVRYVTYEMQESQYQSTFEAMIDAVSLTRGSGYEKGLYAAKTALFPQSRGGQGGSSGYNAGFLRDDAKLAIVFVGDEDDCSDDNALPMEQPTDCYAMYYDLRSVYEYVNDYQSLKARASDIVVSAIVNIPNDERCNPSDSEGCRYIETAQSFNGVVGNIKLSDFSGILQDMGLAAAGIMRSFPLEYVPDISTLEVSVDDELLGADAGWQYNGDSEYPAIEFPGDYVPPRGSKVTIRYERG